MKKIVFILKQSPMSLYWHTINPAQDISKVGRLMNVRWIKEDTSISSEVRPADLTYKPTDNAHKVFESLACHNAIYTNDAVHEICWEVRY